MKLPSLWPVFFFAGGILASGNLIAHLHLTPRLFLLAATFLLLVGFALFYKDLVLSAGIVGLAAWFLLGCGAAGLERTSTPVNLASSLIESGRLDSSVALRWR